LRLSISVWATRRIKNWARDLRGLTDSGVRDRLSLARDYERLSMSKGMGRNPKGGRMWREKVREAEAELERRCLLPD
jgi:hypothetical protein